MNGWNPRANGIEVSERLVIWRDAVSRLGSSSNFWSVRYRHGQESAG